jgi:hypothetical protein
MGGRGPRPDRFGEFGGMLTTGNVAGADGSCGNNIPDDVVLMY